MKKIVYSLIIAAAAAMPTIAHAAVQHDMRFHCAQDTTKINELLLKGRDSGLTSPNKLVAFYGRELAGTPYVAHTLEGATEMLTINIDQLDCTTFVETLYALARTTLNGRYSWRDFANNLENVRYRGGKVDGYASRLHYISEWAVENVSRGNITEISRDFSVSKSMVKTIDFMTKHRDLYPALKDSATYERLRNNEVGYRNHMFHYIRKDYLSNREVKEGLQEGDIVALVTKVEGLDVSHMGVIVKDEKGDVYLLNASQKEGKVVIDAQNLKRALSGTNSNIGIRVFRIKN